MGPPDNVLAEAVPLNVLLTRTETLALIVTGSLVYGNGWEFTLTVLTRTSDDQWEIDPFGYHPRAGGAGTTADALRFGLQFADGRKATNLGFPVRARRRGALCSRADRAGTISRIALGYD